MSAAADYQKVKTSLGASIVRTLVPVIVGAVVGALAKVNLGIDAEAATALATVIITAIYYTGVRLLEEFVAPVWGRLLGIARIPQYVDDGHWVDTEDLGDE